IAIAQFKVVNALEDLGEGFATLEVKVTIIGGLRQAATAVVDSDQILVGLGGRPAGTDRQRRVELPFDLADIESDAECRSGKGRSETDGQWQFRQAPVGFCFCCHRRYSMCFCYGCLDYSQPV